jgi:hypothetical protein
VGRVVPERWSGRSPRVVVGGTASSPPRPRLPATGAGVRRPRPAASPTMMTVRSALLLLALLVSLTGCPRKFAVGDHVFVEWEGQNYPAMIKEAPSSSKFKVHYDGYDDVWDQEVTRDKIKGLVEGVVVQPEPPAKVRAKAIQAAQTNVYKIGDRLRVEWHGQIYPATISGIVGQERYRIRYDGYGPEWDETVGLSRIQPK